jgi:hypothetical protein
MSPIGRASLLVTASAETSSAIAQLTLSPDHGYVGLSLLAAVFVHNFFMNFKVVAAR